jgi:5'-3' exonuclease
MGIESFISSIENNQIINIDKSFAHKLDNKLKTNHFYIDFNSVVYNVSSVIIDDINYAILCIIRNNIDDIAKKTIDKYHLKYNDKMTYIDFYNTTSIVIHDIVIKNVCKYIINLIANSFETNYIELIYVAIDGVPSKSKMMEQKRRRYMEVIIKGVQSKLFSEYEHIFDNNEYRLLYEKYKFSFTKSDITPGTKFMENLANALKNDLFKKQIHNMCKNLKTYYVSDYTELGEGEKKIIDYVHKYNDPNKNITIYSPDSDADILCMTLHTFIYNEDKKSKGTISVLKYNKQKNQNDVIHIDILINNLYKYVLHITSNNNISKFNVSDDICLIFTLFGNDFVPMIESISIKYNLIDVINIYIRTILPKKDNIRYLTHKQSGKTVIVYKNFLRFLKKLSRRELFFMKKKQLNDNYIGYNRIVGIIGSEKKLISKLKHFVKNLKQFKLDVIGDDNILDRWKDSDFIKLLKKLAIFNDGIKTTDDDNFIANIKEYIKTNKTFPNLIFMKPKIQNTYNISYHQNNIRREFIHAVGKFNVSTYDIELYKFNNMLDKFTDILNARHILFGKINMNTNNVSVENIENDIHSFYANFFDVDINNNICTLDNIINNYFEGVVWTFENYFNFCDYEHTLNHGYTWIYLYEKAPLITHIYNFLKKQSKSYFLDKCERVMSMKMPKKEYYKPIEHFMFVAPCNHYINSVPDKYHKFIKQSKYYTNLNEIVDKLFDKVRGNEVSCRGIRYLNKCTLKILRQTVHIDDNQFLIDIRKINNDVS